jgi:transcriptional regulator with XRE-family HTH domain
MPRPMTLPPPWLDLAHHIGGVSGIAWRCGVSPSTVYRWARGISTPSEEHQEHLCDVFDDYSLPQPTFRTLRPE